MRASGASDSNCSVRPPKALVASIATFPWIPFTLPRASAIAPDGTATRITSASEASPPSLPSSLTSCPAARHSFARPPPMFPLPIVVIFMTWSTREAGVGFRPDGARVPHRPRPRRLDTDRPPPAALPGGAGDAAREARVHESGWLEQGPDRSRDDRGRGARRETEARRHDRRADLRQHGRRARDRSSAQGLPLHLRDAGQDEPGEDRHAPRLRRRRRDHPDRGRPRLARVVLLGLLTARRGD